MMNEQPADIALLRSPLEKAADERVQELTVMGPEGRLHELAKMYVAIDRLGVAIEAAVWAVGRAEEAYLVGGELIGGNADNFLEVKTIGGSPPFLTAQHPSLRRALTHARTIEKVLRGRLMIFSKLNSNHQSVGKLLVGMGL